MNQVVMKKILFDLRGCQPNRESKFHGGGIYGYIVLKSLIKQIPERIVVYYDANRFVAPDVEQMMADNSIVKIDANERPLLQCIKENEVGVFYSPLFNKSYKQLQGLNIPIIITIHGLRNLEMNRDKTEKFYARSLFDRVKAWMKQTPYYSHLLNKYWEEKKWLFENENVHIITVSNHSKYSILYYYPFVDEKRINVMYSVSTTPEGYENTKPYATDKYYLIVSANRWLKNAYRAIKAFDNLFDNPQYDINGRVVVLGLSPKTSIYKRIKHKDRFELMGYVDKDTLESLYKGAYALVYPSLNEGFGYPPLEAMKYGTPVIASPFASITEVCGDAVLYANPYSIEEIANRILQVEQKEIHEIYKTQGCKQFSNVLKVQKSDLVRLSDLLLNN